jgi:hypothetical protein
LKAIEGIYEDCSRHGVGAISWPDAEAVNSVGGNLLNRYEGSMIEGYVRSI